MKRIIEGSTYSTDTATVIAEGPREEDERNGSARTMTLYQNRAGAFFIVEVIETSYKDRYDEWQTREHTEWEVVGSAAKARKACEEYGLTIIQDIDDMPPEAEAGPQLPTVYTRIPPALKAALEERAKAEDVSVNKFMLRCIERCLSEKAA